jgi:hypothetical protein
MRSHLGRYVVFTVLSSGALSAQAARDPAPLHNWAAPLFWQPNTNESREIAQKGGAQPRVQGQPGANPSVFVAMTPCRLLDTRATFGFTGQWGPPSLSAGVTRTFPIYNDPNCTVPSIAVAYSLNVTVVPPVGGTVGFLTIWPYGVPQPNASTLNDQVVTQNGANPVVANAAIVPAGSDSEGSIQAYSFNNTDLVIDINGYYAAETDASQNTATGDLALSSLDGGTVNTADGYEALQSDTTGTSNTAIGWTALFSNSAGCHNTATGAAALGLNQGNCSTTPPQGSYNTAQGDGSLNHNVTGSYNAAMGYWALQLATGSSNTAIGAYAGQSNSGGSGNIYIGADIPDQPTGTSESNTIRIGCPAATTAPPCTSQTTTTYIGGIATNGITGGAAVYIDSNGLLGFNASSIRYKEDVQDMGDASSDLLKLRPVTFRYKQPDVDGSKPLDYGLIAEEVEQIYPNLVVKDKDGQIQTVQYQKLTPMLLNELKKQHEELLRQQKENRELEQRIAALEARIAGKDTDDQ